MCARLVSSLALWAPGREFWNGPVFVELIVVPLSFLACFVLLPLRTHMTHVERSPSFSATVAPWLYHNSTSPPASSPHRLISENLGHSSFLYRRLPPIDSVTTVNTQKIDVNDGYATPRHAPPRAACSSLSRFMAGGSNRRFTSAHRLSLGICLDSINIRLSTPRLLFPTPPPPLRHPFPPFPGLLRVASMRLGLYLLSRICSRPWSYSIDCSLGFTRP